MYLFFMRSTTPKNMMTKRRMPAMTPAIFTVWSVCFSGSTAFGLWVAAPEKHQNSEIKQRKCIQADCESTLMAIYYYSTWTKQQSTQSYTFSVTPYWCECVQDSAWLINTLIFCGILPQSIHIHGLKGLFILKASYCLLSTFSCDLSATWIKLHLGR